MKAEVEKGIKLLDEKVPGWRERIDPDSLDMSDCFQCILGQLFGSFSDGSKKLGFVWLGNTEDFGFEVKQRFAPLPYDELTNLWKKELEKRHD